MFPATIAYNIIIFIIVIAYRSQVTVLHHNENAIRPHLVNIDGTERVKIVRKKETAQTPTVYHEKEGATYGRFSF